LPGWEAALDARAVVVEHFYVFLDPRLEPPAARRYP
jgi:hypothetical protein